MSFRNDAAEGKPEAEAFKLVARNRVREVAKRLVGDLQTVVLNLEPPEAAISKDSHVDALFLVGGVPLHGLERVSEEVDDEKLNFKRVASSGSVML